MQMVDRRLCVSTAGWTPERVARLIQLCETTLFSATQMAAELGVTRGSIIGKCDRDGLTLPGSLHVPFTPEQMKERKKKLKRERRSIQRPWRATSSRNFRMERAFAMNPDNETRVGLMDLTEDHCRWPYGEAGAIEYCGVKPEDGKPYCAFHCCIAYQPASAMQRKPSLFRYGGRAA